MFPPETESLSQRKRKPCDHVMDPLFFASDTEVDEIPGSHYMGMGQNLESDPPCSERPLRSNVSMGFRWVSMGFARGRESRSVWNHWNHWRTRQNSGLPASEVGRTGRSEWKMTDFWQDHDCVFFIKLCFKPRLVCFRLCFFRPFDLCCVSAFFGPLHLQAWGV